MEEMAAPGPLEEHDPCTAPLSLLAATAVIQFYGCGSATRSACEGVSRCRKGGLAVLLRANGVQAPLAGRSAVRVR